MIRVQVVSAHPIVSTALCNLIRGEADLAVVGVSGGGEAAITIAVDRKPDVILLDTHTVPGQKGLDTAARLARLVPTARVLFLTSAIGQNPLVEAIKAGEVEYVLKQWTPDELLAKIRALYAGSVSQDGEAASDLA